MQKYNLKPFIWTQSSYQSELKALKSDSHAKGLASEKKVYEFFIANGFQCFGHRIKIFQVEIDLVFLSPKGIWHFVEVKSQDLACFPLCESQKKRLLRVLDKFCEYTLARLHVVSFYKGRMEFLPDALDFEKQWN